MFFRVLIRIPEGSAEVELLLHKIHIVHRCSQYGHRPLDAKPLKEVQHLHRKAPAQHHRVRTERLIVNRIPRVRFDQNSVALAVLCKDIETDPLARFHIDRVRLCQKARKLLSFPGGPKLLHQGVRILDKRLYHLSFLSRSQRLLKRFSRHLDETRAVCRHDTAVIDLHVKAVLAPAIHDKDEIVARKPCF